MRRLDELWEKYTDARTSVLAAASVWREHGSSTSAEMLREAVDEYEAAGRAWDAAYSTTTAEGRAEESAVVAMVAEGAPEQPGARL